MYLPRKFFKKWHQEIKSCILSMVRALKLILNNVMSTFLETVQLEISQPSKHFNVGSTLFLGWYETTLCTSTLKFTTSNNVETTLCISTFNWLIDRLTFSFIFNVDFHNIGQRRNNVANMAIWKKVKNKIQKQNNIFDLQRICSTQNLLHFFPILKRICKRIFAELEKSLKHQIYWITKSIFKLSHFVKCQSVFNFKRQVQAHSDYRIFYFICIF